MGAGFNIILHEFENDGCVSIVKKQIMNLCNDSCLYLLMQLFSTCINATALALLNAGCSMRCTFAAVTILVNETTNSIIVDPSQLQINTVSVNFNLKTQFHYFKIININVLMLGV